MDIDLLQETPSKAVIPATFKQVCNLGAAGLMNPGLEEEFYLDVPSQSLSSMPFSLSVGVTTFPVRRAGPSRPESGFEEKKEEYNLGEKYP